MRTKLQVCFLIILAVANQAVAQQRRVFEGAEIILPSAKLRFTRALRLHRLFFEVGKARIYPTKFQFSTPGVTASGWTRSVQLPDGRTIRASIDSTPQEYYTGLMERVVDGPQAKSWATGISEAMDMRGQKVDMIIKPTTSIYAPYYLSSRGYAAIIPRLRSLC